MNTNEKKSKELFWKLRLKKMIDNAKSMNRERLNERSTNNNIVRVHCTWDDPIIVREHQIAAKLFDLPTEIKFSEYPLRSSISKAKVLSVHLNEISDVFLCYVYRYFIKSKVLLD